MNLTRLLLVSTLLAGTVAFAADAQQPAAPAKAKADYPLTTCVVSGDKLGVMGESVEYIYKEKGQPDRTVMFCCKDCIADFEKEPAKYLQKLDEAAAAKASAGSAQHKH